MPAKVFLKFEKEAVHSNLVSSKSMFSEGITTLSGTSNGVDEGKKSDGVEKGTLCIADDTGFGVAKGIPL